MLNEGKKAIISRAVGDKSLKMIYTKSHAAEKSVKTIKVPDKEIDKAIQRMSELSPKYREMLFDISLSRVEKDTEGREDKGEGSAALSAMAGSAMSIALKLFAMVYAPESEGVIKNMKAANDWLSSAEFPDLLEQIFPVVDSHVEKAKLDEKTN